MFSVSLILSVSAFFYFILSSSLPPFFLEKFTQNLANVWVERIEAKRGKKYSEYFSDSVGQVQFPGLEKNLSKVAYRLLGATL